MPFGRVRLSKVFAYWSMKYLNEASMRTIETTVSTMARIPTIFTFGSLDLIYFIPQPKPNGAKKKLTK